MLPNLVIALLLVAVGFKVAGWVQSGALRLLERATGNRPISQLLSTVARISVIAVAVFVALGLLNLDRTVTSLLAGVGVVGLALGFAFQDIAANFMSGIIMAIDRPFKNGDFVEVNGHRGRVGDMSLRATTIETLDGLSILVPNKDIFQNAIINVTLNPTRRLEISVGTAYCDDMPKVAKVVRDALGDLSHRLADKEVEVLFEAFGDSSINSKVLIWLDDAEEITFRRVRSEAMIKIKAAFDREKLTIPFPIRTLDFGAGVVGGARLDAMKLHVERAQAAE